MTGAIIAHHGTEEQKARWLPGLASGGLKASFAITEPDAGSNAHRLATTATRNGSGYVISGQKVFISGMEDAGIVMVVARSGTDEGSGRGLLSVFVLDPDMPGVTRTELPTALQGAEAPVDRSTWTRSRSTRIAASGARTTASRWRSRA